LSQPGGLGTASRPAPESWRGDRSTRAGVFLVLSGERNRGAYGEAVGHPIMFRDDDPVLARVRHIVLGFPGSAEKISHGRPAFYTTKIFAYYGGSVKVDGVWVEHDQSLLVLPDQSDRTALLQNSRTYVPGYLGNYGWIGFDLGVAEAAWEQVRELIDSSYRNTATARLVAELDSG